MRDFLLSIPIIESLAGAELAAQVAKLRGPVLVPRVASSASLRSVDASRAVSGETSRLAPTISNVDAQTLPGFLSDRPWEQTLSLQTRTGSDGTILRGEAALQARVASIASELGLGSDTLQPSDVERARALISGTAPVRRVP